MCLSRVFRAALCPLSPKRSAGFLGDADGPFHGTATGTFRIRSGVIRGTTVEDGEIRQVGETYSGT